MNGIYDLLKRLPVLKKKKSAALAGVLGFLVGGIGLAIYFKSWIDLVVPILLALVAGIVVQALAHTGAEGGAVVAGAYGVFRAITSNEAIEKSEKAEA